MELLSPRLRKKFKNTTSNRVNIGFATHHLLNPIESFSNNDIKDSKIPTKMTFHSEFYSAIPLSISTQPFIPYYRILAKHERYIKNKKRIFSKTWWVSNPRPNKQLNNFLHIYLLLFFEKW